MMKLLRTIEIIGLILLGISAGFVLNSTWAGFWVAFLVLAMSVGDEAVTIWRSQKNGKNATVVAISFLFCCWSIYSLVSLNIGPRDTAEKQGSQQQEQLLRSAARPSNAIMRIDLSLLPGCCPSQVRGAVQQECMVKVDIEYCHTQIVNNAPISACFVSHEVRWGTYDPINNCCCLVMPELGNSVVCVRPGTVVTVGPIVFSTVAPATTKTE